MCLQSAAAADESTGEELLAENSAEVTLVEPASDAPLTEEPSDAKRPSAASVIRGTTLSLTQSASAISLDKSYDPTYNPYYAMTFNIAPLFWLSDDVHLRWNFSASKELTEADDETYDGEFQPSDLSMGVGAHLWTIPVVGIDLSAGFDVTLPTSKVSRARTMNVALSESFRIAKTFDVLSGISIGTSVRGTEYFYDYTTSETVTPRVSGCGRVGGCDAFLNTGVRNTATRLVNSADLSVAFIDELSLSVTAALYSSFLFEGASDDRVSTTTLTPTDNRWATSYGIALNYAPFRGFNTTLGVDTTNPVQATDQTYYPPFFNRYTLVYLDLQVEVSGIFSLFE